MSALKSILSKVVDRNKVKQIVSKGNEKKESGNGGGWKKKLVLAGIALVAVAAIYIRQWMVKKKAKEAVAEKVELEKKLSKTRESKLREQSDELVEQMRKSEEKIKEKLEDTESKIKDIENEKQENLDSLRDVDSWGVFKRSFSGS